MSLKLFIFDCDGTIVDSQHTIIEGMAQAFEVNGYPAPRDDETRSIIGLSLDPAVAFLAPNLPEPDRAQVVDSYRDYVVAKRANGDAIEHLYDGAKEVIETLADVDEVLLGIATGKAYRGVLHLFDSYGWHDHFVTVQTSDRAPSKPHPGMILQAMEETGIAAADTVMIGDTSYDIEMAVSAGVAGVGVTWGYHSDDTLRQAGAAHMVNDYKELHTLLNGMLRS